MSVTINLTEGNKVTIKRQDPISLTLEKKAASSVSITQQANVAISLQNKAPSFISIIKPGFSGSVTLWGSIAGTVTDQTDLVDYIAEQIADIPTPATPTLQSVTDAGAITTNDITTGSVTSNGNFLITGNDSTVQLRGSSVDFNIQTTAADNVARIATTTGGSARLDLYNHISGFNGALEFRATSWENDALVISGGTPNTTKFLVSRDPNAATLQVTGESYFTGNVGIGTTAPSEKLEVAGNIKSTKLLLNTTNAGYTFYSNGESRINNITFQSVGNDDYLQKSANDGRFWIRNGRSGQSILLGANDSNGQFNDYLLIDGNNQELRVRTASSDRFIINSTGNVGIGTTAPAYKLHVDGGTIGSNLNSTGSNTDRQINLTSANTIGMGVFSSYSSNTDVVADFFGKHGYTFNGGINTPSKQFQVYVSDAANPKMVVNGSGNVGIGTTAPAAKLHVAGEIRVNAGQPLMLDAANTIYAVAAQNQFRLYSGGSPAINVTTSGNVGIGTTAPSSLLHIARTLNGEVLRLQDTSNANQNYVFETEAAGSYYGLNLKNGNTGDTIVNFSANGKLGIKTNNPDKALTINETAENDVQIKIGYHFGIGYYQGGQTRSVIGSTYGNDAAMMSFVLGGYTTASDKMTILGSGNVGIGTTTPAAKLHVNGGFISGASTTSGLYFNPASDRLSISNQRVLEKSGASLFLGYNANQLIFRTNNLERARFDVNGNLGIGTTAPASKLHVDGGTDSISMRLKTNNVLNYILLNNSTSANNYLQTNNRTIALSADENGVDGKVFLKTSNQNRVTVNGIGDVGVGTTAPDSKLHVSAASGIAFKVNPNSVDKEWYIDTTNPDHLKKEGNLILNADPTGVHTSTFIGLNVDGSNKMRIQHDGTVGIGTTSPTSNLHINGTAMRQLRLEVAGGPSSNTDTAGGEGDFAYDDQYLYIKTGSGWGRVALDFAF